MSDGKAIVAERSYFDWNATAPLRPEAADALAAALSLTGNPSSVHAEGRAARQLVEHAREDVARLVGAQPGNVIFTSSGTEANALALTPAIETADEKKPRGKLLHLRHRASVGARRRAFPARNDRRHSG